MNDAAENYIGLLYRLHDQNSKSIHYARVGQGRPYPTMPGTSFVYEFFIYNSVYQVDWEATQKSPDKLIRLENQQETTNQSRLEEFMKEKSQTNPEIVFWALRPFTELNLEGKWTQVSQGSNTESGRQNIDLARGEQFFQNLRALQRLLRQKNKPVKKLNTIFDQIKFCRLFVYEVRCNLFHGTKTIGRLGNKDQARRLEVYDLLLKCLTSMFFLSVGREAVVSDHVEVTIADPSPPVGDKVYLDQRCVHEVVYTRKYMEEGDSHLVAQFHRKVPIPKQPPPEGAALFYPSAGHDLLTPILLGLPYCREFYFYDVHVYRAPLKGSRTFLETIQNLCGTLDHQNKPQRDAWETTSYGYMLAFKYDGTSRTIHLMKQDNQKFLESDARLAFYFHRGDRDGKGGSEQRWDSDLFPKLMKKVPTDRQGLFLTTGEPGGLNVPKGVKTYTMTKHIPAL